MALEENNQPRGEKNLAEMTTAQTVGRSKPVWHSSIPYNHAHANSEYQMNNQHKVAPAQFKIATLVGARPGDIMEISSEEMLKSLKDRIHPHVLEVVTDAAGARFWRFGKKFFFEDCAEGEDPINFDDLRYDSEIGLHSVDEIDD